MDTISMDHFKNHRRDNIEFIINESNRAYDKNKPQEFKQSKTKAVSSKVNSDTPVETTALLDTDEEMEDYEIEPTEEMAEEAPKKKGQQPKENCISSLNLSGLFRGENPTYVDGKGRASFTLLKNLLNVLYGGQEFFEKSKEAIPDIEERFILDLYEKAKDQQSEINWIKLSKHLSCIELDDKNLNHLRKKMMNGNKEYFSVEDLDKAGYFSLKKFISVNEREKVMSLWLAQRPILMALFQDEKIVQEVLEARREILTEMDRKRLDKEGAEKELQLRFGIYCGDLKEYIDFSVSGSLPKDLAPSKRKRTKK
jgi:hypothetical protein